MYFIILTVSNLLASHGFLLCGDSALTRDLAGAGVGMRPLAAHRKIAAVAEAAVALNFDQPADVHLRLLAEIAFHAAFRFDRRANVTDFLLGKIFYFFVASTLAFSASERARCWPMP